ncbi:MAG: hypothetical protein LC768_01850 [Acidobacteria bacterium]|nr:hypothetical protein [Acidobacteriota bacterium]MCA1637076.1 hypothetical protein [Acidobacteriota bacterium]
MMYLSHVRKIWFCSLKDETSGLLLFKDSDLKSLGFFVIAKSAVADKNQVINDAKKALLQKLFPKQSQNYIWKPINITFFGKDKPMSKFDVSFGAEKGYNQTQLIFFNFRQVNFKERDVFIGYIYEHPSGINAKKGFEGNFDDSLYNSCIAQVELVYSITGEKIAKDMHPCSIIGNSGSAIAD